MRFKLLSAEFGAGDLRIVDTRIGPSHESFHGNKNYLVPTNLWLAPIVQYVDGHQPQL